MPPPFLELHGCMWEHDENVVSCRQCAVKFRVITRKHHCRQCGGIFCEACCKEIPGDSFKDRSCDGCRYGEAPGEKVKQIATRNCTDSGNNNTTNAVSKLGSLTVPAVSFNLARGLLFPEDEDDQVSPTAVSLDKYTVF